MANDKNIGFSGNRKRSSNVERGREERKVEPPKQGRKRKPETLHRYRQELLQPWLDFANLLQGRELNEDEKPALRGAFVKRFAKDRSPAARPLQNLAAGVQGGYRSLLSLVVGKHGELERTFLAVRNTLLTVSKMPLVEDAYMPDATGIGEIVDLQVRFGIGDQDGYLIIQPDILFAFLVALVGGSVVDALFETGTLSTFGEKKTDKRRQAKPVRVETRRIRTCPVCQSFYYAVRGNTGACDEHQTLARTRRTRDPELRRQYKKAMQINRLTRAGIPIGEATARIQAKATRRRKAR